VNRDGDQVTADRQTDRQTRLRIPGRDGPDRLSSQKGARQQGSYLGDGDTGVNISQVPPYLFRQNPGWPGGAVDIGLGRCVLYLGLPCPLDYGPLEEAARSRRHACESPSTGETRRDETDHHPRVLPSMQPMPPISSVLSQRGRREQGPDANSTSTVHHHHHHHHQPSTGPESMGTRRISFRIASRLAGCLAGMAGMAAPGCPGASMVVGMEEALIVWGLASPPRVASDHEQTAISPVSPRVLPV